MKLSFLTDTGERIDPDIDRLILAGFAGRSSVEVEAHIEEMAGQGVPRPPFSPMFWPVVPHLITQAANICVYGPDTAPEVEYVLFGWQGSLYVTVGNDQCDIEVERELSSEKSKNLCPKVVATRLWRVDDVMPHWDELRLILSCNGTVMQEDRLAVLLRPETLMEKIAALDGGGENGRMIFSGTIGSHGSYPAAPYAITMRLSDPKFRREIRHDFTVTALSSFS
jgi:hypothetical protein